MKNGAREMPQQLRVLAILEEGTGQFAGIHVIAHHHL